MLTYISEGERFDYCDDCGCYIHESHPRHETKEENLCIDCTFKRGLITDKEYLPLVGIGLLSSKTKAIVHEGEIYVSLHGEKFEFKKNNKDYRRTKQYTEWRNEVFERDKYTCQHCSQIGGELNAHHIKSFANFKELRYEIDNGLTLCAKCHRKLHKTIR